MLLFMSNKPQYPLYKASISFYGRQPVLIAGKTFVRLIITFAGNAGTGLLFVQGPIIAGIVAGM